jgi:hypothetical protein
VTWKLRLAAVTGGSRKRPVRRGEAMSSHSEEIWESYDALWRQVRILSRRIGELEARLGAAEDREMKQGGVGFKPRREVDEESNKPDFVYEGD